MRRHERKARSQGAQVSPDVARSGERVDGAVLRNMESRFQRDFSGVRVHTDSAADSSARALGASAYSLGRDIFFAAGQYRPRAFGGRLLLAHELSHVAQEAGRDSDPSGEPAVEGRNSAAETEAARNSFRVALGLQAERISASHAGIALTPTGDKVTPLISHSWKDWSVTAADEANVVALLAADPDLSATVVDLNTAGMLGTLIDRVDENATRRQMLQLMGAQLNPAAKALAEPLIVKLGRTWELQYNLGGLGVTSAAPAFNKAGYSDLVSSDPSKGFTGSGATGISPTKGDISTIDQTLLAAKHGATVKKYTNPASDDLPGYLSGVKAADRPRQAQLLLQQPISTVDEKGYAGNLPSRAQVIRAAAATHKLHPAMVAAFILGEQRDQSKNEDAKDYLGATSMIYQANTSIGLGQVVVSTAQKNDLFADTLSAGTRGKLSHDQVAKLLASDEYNILAAARYMRKVADDGAKIDIATLPNTKAEFPGIDMAAYAADSSTWPDDNIRALASEYTSAPWDDRLSTGWAWFVFEAYKDVKAGKVF